MSILQREYTNASVFKGQRQPLSIFVRVLRSQFGTLTPSRLATRVTNFGTHFIDVKETEIPIHKHHVGLGLSFIPTPRPPTYPDLSLELDALKRRVALRLLFDAPAARRPPPQPPPRRRLYVPNPSFIPVLPDDVQSALDFVFTHITRKFSLSFKENPRLLKKFYRSNLSFDALGSIKSLGSSSKFVVKAADKNLGTCIMSRSWYRDQVRRHLHDDTTYQRVRNVPSGRIAAELRSLMDNIAVEAISDNDKKYILHKCPKLVSDSESDSDDHFSIPPLYHSQNSQESN